MVQLLWGLVVLALVVSCPTVGQAAKYKAVRRANGTTVYVKQRGLKDYVLLPVQLVTAPFRKNSKGKLNGFGKPMTQKQMQAPMSTGEMTRSVVRGMGTSMKRVVGLESSNPSSGSENTVIASPAGSQAHSR